MMAKTRQYRRGRVNLGDPAASTSPHDFRPFSWLDRLRPRQGRCYHCLFPRAAHPIRYVWVAARYLGQKTAAHSYRGTLVEGYLATVAAHESKERAE